MTPRLPKLLLAAALVAGASLAQAKEIDVDDLTITAPRTGAGRASFVPWSGVWWAFSATQLAKGWNGTGDDFGYDAGSKTWSRASGSKPMGDISPFLKYDEYVRATTGTDPQSALLEVAGDAAQSFMHNVYGDQKDKFDKDGVSYSWWGHCNGWCGAALMEKEPMAPIEAQGVRFEVADLKGLLSETWWSCQSDFTGKRYNKPRDIYSSSREPGKALLAALDAGAPKPVADYIAWYEKVWETTMDAAAKAAAKPADFRQKLELFDRWYKDTYEEAYKDIYPNVFHQLLESVIGRRKMALVMDIAANEEVWNHPAFRYETSIAASRDFTENGAARKEWNVATTVWYATDGVSQSVIGISEFSKRYTYTLVTDETGKVIRGDWQGASVDDHPDFAWLPISNPLDADTGENYKVLYGKILEILPAAHGTADARAIELAANGTRASTRRGDDRTTTWAQPVAAAGDVRLTVAVASGQAVASVKYFEQHVDGGADVTASREALVPLAESAAAPDYAAVARFASSGKKMVVAYAYDAGGRLLGYDEITVAYALGGSTSGGSTGAGHTRDTALAAGAGARAGLYCEGDDWWRVTLAAPGSITVRIAFTNAQGDLDMTLESEAGAQIAKSDSTNDFEQVAGASLAPGAYFVHVYGYNGAKNHYSMTVTAAAASGGTTGAGHDRASAAPIAAGSYPGLHCAGEDWYKVTLAGPGELAVRIDFRNADGDLDLYVYDEAGGEVGRSDGTTDGESVSKTGLAAGAYYVKVLGYNGATNDYSLTVGVTGAVAAARTGTVTAGALNVRSGPGRNYSVVTHVTRGTVVTIQNLQNGFYRITWSGAPAAGALWASASYITAN